jgi:hypothetical protein
MPYDQTEIDVLMNAELPETREISAAVTMLTQIREIINGEVLYENDTFFVIKSDGRKVHFADEAIRWEELLCKKSSDMRLTYRTDCLLSASIMHIFPN